MKKNDDLSCGLEGKTNVGKDHYRDISQDIKDLKTEELNEEFTIFDVISTILDDDILTVNTFTTNQPIEEFEPFQEKWDELTLTEKIQVNWSSELYNICRRAKNLYNFALFICRKIYFLHKKNPNVSWDDFLTIRENIMPEPSVKDYTQKRQKLLETFDKLQNIIKYKVYDKIGDTLSTLIKYSKFYKNIGYAQSSQQINRVLGRAWQTYETNLNLFYDHELEHRPNLPYFKHKDGEFMMIYTLQDIRSVAFERHLDATKRTVRYKTYSKTTAELLFPKKHRYLPPIRVRYDILKNVREVRIIPKSGYYEIEIRYKKDTEDYGLSRNNAISIDLGMRNPLTIVNNLGLQSILLQGRELKEANYFINSKSPYYRSIQDVYNDILKRFKENKSKTVLEIIQEKAQKYIKVFQWKEMVADIILNNPKMTYNQFKALNDKSKKLKNLFTYLKTKKKTTITDYLFYEEKELKRRLDICDSLNDSLEREYEQDRLQYIKTFQQKNQEILNKLFRVYMNKTRDAIHKISRFVITLCKQYDIGTIMIGYNEGWKSHSKMNKAVNRKFIPLPFYKLIESIKYKALLCGIKVIVQEESYTSKCSAIDKESIEFHIEYAGIRNITILGRDGKSQEHYGQFYSYISQKYIHSDVNGAFNIGRKGAPHLFECVPQRQMLIPPRRIAVA